MPHTQFVAPEVNQDPLSDLADELVQLARRLIDRAFVRVEGEDPPDLPILYGLANQHFHEEWSRDRVDGLETLIRHGALKLVGSFGEISRAKATFLLFNLDDGKIFKKEDEIKSATSRV